MMEQELRTLIKTLSGLSEVHWGFPPDHTDYPMILLHHVSSNYDYALDKSASVATIIQVDVWTKNFTQSVSVREALLAGLSARKGTAFKGIFINNIRQAVDTTTPDKLFRVSIDLRIIA